MCGTDKEGHGRGVGSVCEVCVGAATSARAEVCSCECVCYLRAPTDAMVTSPCVSTSRCVDSDARVLSVRPCWHEVAFVNSSVRGMCMPCEFESSAGLVPAAAGCSSSCIGSLLRICSVL